MRRWPRLRAGLAVLSLVIASLSEVAPSQSVAIPGFASNGNGQFYTVNFAVLPPGDAFVNRLSLVCKPAEYAPQLGPERLTSLYQVATPNHRASRDSCTLCVSHRSQES